MWPNSTTWNAPTTPQHCLQPHDAVFINYQTHFSLQNCKQDGEMGSLRTPMRNQCKATWRARKWLRVQWKGICRKQEGDATLFCRVYIFWVRDVTATSQSLFPLLIIPIIMAHYENLINNAEDIVVAISHMVVGLCSVTIFPLASTYVCHRHAAMTSSSSAHLALPAVRKTLKGVDGGWGWVLLLLSRMSEFCVWYSVRLGTKCQPVSGMAHQTGALGGRREKAPQNKIWACVLF